MKLRSAIVLFGLCAPVFAQYAGPAILARGEAPSSGSEFEIRFRPRVDVGAVYDNGLAAASVRNGELVKDGSAGVMVGWAVSGTHRWRHTSLGLDYRGGVTHYTRRTYYDSLSQSLLFGLTHRFSRHAVLSVREAMGIFSRLQGVSGLSQSVPFDPVASSIPSSEFFDNRTIYQTLQADFTLQRSSRLSINLGGDNNIIKRRSQALSSVVGAGARADVQYRISRRSTIGAGYRYTRYMYSHGMGDSDTHTWIGSYSAQLARRWEFSGYGGVSHIESKFLTRVAVDPIIAALLGITSTAQIVHSRDVLPNAGGRLARVFSHGLAWVSAGHDVAPGNGIFLTSYATSAGAGYTYNGIRSWSISASAGYGNYNSIGTIAGHYRNTMQSVSISRQLGRTLHLVGAADLRQYGSNDYSRYSRNVFGVRMGLAFSPGDLPLRLR